MNILVATDGSKYGRWGLDWVAKLAFIQAPRVTAPHVLDLGALGQTPQGLGAIDRFLLGSVSTRVVQHANRSVLVVR